MKREFLPEQKLLLQFLPEQKKIDNAPPVI